MSEINFLSAAQMAEHIRSRKLSSIEVIEAHLAQIERLNPKLNAFVQVDAEGACKQAREAESAVKQGKRCRSLSTRTITRVCFRQLLQSAVRER